MWRRLGTAAPAVQDVPDRGAFTTAPTTDPGDATLDADLHVDATFGNAGELVTRGEEVEVVDAGEQCGGDLRSDLDRERPAVSSCLAGRQEPGLG